MSRVILRSISPVLPRLLLQQLLLIGGLLGGDPPAARQAGGGVGGGSGRGAEVPQGGRGSGQSEGSVTTGFRSKSARNR